MWLIGCERPSHIGAQSWFHQSWPMQGISSGIGIWGGLSRKGWTHSGAIPSCILFSGSTRFLHLRIHLLFCSTSSAFGILSPRCLQNRHMTQLSKETLIGILPALLVETFQVFSNFWHCFHLFMLKYGCLRSQANLSIIPVLVYILPKWALYLFEYNFLSVFCFLLHHILCIKLFWGSGRVGFEPYPEVL